VSDEEQEQEPTAVQQTPYQPAAEDQKATPEATVQQAMPTETGHPAVDSMIVGLADIVDLPARDQVTAYGDVHRTLQDTLATIDER